MKLFAALVVIGLASICCLPKDDKPSTAPKPPIAFTNKGGVTIPINNGIGINPSNGRMTIEMFPGYHFEP